MGVYIKDLEMPKDCRECRFGSLESCETEPTIIRCIVLNRFTHEVDWYEYCPLVGVKPHGRLIDADALYNKMMEKTHGIEHQLLVLNTISFDAPTIIEADKDSLTTDNTQKMSVDGTFQNGNNHSINYGSTTETLDTTSVEADKVGDESSASQVKGDEE